MANILGPRVKATSTCLFLSNGDLNWITLISIFVKVSTYFHGPHAVFQQARRHIPSWGNLLEEQLSLPTRGQHNPEPHSLSETGKCGSSLAKLFPEIIELLNNQRHHDLCP